MAEMKDIAFFLGGVPYEEENTSCPEEAKVDYRTGGTVVRDGLSMDERWARNPINYANYMNEKLSRLFRVAN